MNDLKPVIDRRYERLTKIFEPIRQRLDLFGQTDLDGIISKLAFDDVLDRMESARYNYVRVSETDAEVGEFIGLKT